MSNNANLNLSEYLPYLVNRLGSALVVSMSSNCLTQHGLNIDTWRILSVLSYRGAQRQVDLVDMTSIDASTVSRLVSRLVRLALVTRRRSDTSSREVIINLTAKGNALVNRIIPYALELEQTAASGISVKDMTVIKRSLMQMFENMRQQGVAKTLADKQRKSKFSSRQALLG